MVADTLAVAGTRIRRYDREEFLSSRWRYKPGEHVCFVAPTQAGKTTLAFQLLQRTVRPGLPAIVAVMKPRDPVPAAWGRHLGFPETPTWPPKTRLPWEEKVSGNLLWPRHSFDTQTDNEHLSAQIGAGLHHSYRRGKHIFFADEVYGLCAELGLTDDLIAIWTRGGGMGTGLWTATQRPGGSAGHGIPGHMYSNATHLFLSKDPDAQSRKRYGEIGGVDPKLLSAAVMALRRYEWIYIHRGDAKGGPYLAVINSA